MMGSFVNFPRWETGGVSFFTQTGIFTGAVMLNVMTGATQRLPVGKSIDVGNKIDVDELDFLHYVARRSRHKGDRLLYREHPQSARVLRQGASEVRKEQADRGAQARPHSRQAHARQPRTPARLPPTTTSSTARCGSTALRAPRTRTIFSTRCARSSCCRRPRGKRVGLATTSGALGVISTDLLVESGLELATFAPETLATMRTDPAGLAGAGQSVRFLDQHRRQGTARSARGRPHRRVCRSKCRSRACARCWRPATPTFPSSAICCASCASTYDKPVALVIYGGEAAAALDRRSRRRQRSDLQDHARRRARARADGPGNGLDLTWSAINGYWLSTPSVPALCARRSWRNRLRPAR